jgi:anthranilate phosphoribosyltransferase
VNSSQVLKHLNVFADHDIDAAAEAIDDVSISFLFRVVSNFV